MFRLDVRDLGAWRQGGAGFAAVGLFVMLLVGQESPLRAESPSLPPGPRIAGVERVPGNRPADQILRGMVLLGELGCTHCHAASEGERAHLAVRTAPLLENVGQRVRATHFEAWLTDPERQKPGSTMPHLLRGMEPDKRSATIRALAHYLAQSGSPPSGNSGRKGVRRGEILFQTIGCAVCHGPQNLHDGKPDEPRLPDTVPLGNLSEKYTAASLAQFLLNPLSARPSARMPNLHLKAEEARDLASYLVREATLDPNLKYEYFEGTWDKLPDFSTLTAKSTGECSGLDVELGRLDGFAIRYRGYLHIRQEGQYRFHLGSDDGSRLRIDGNEVVAVDGIHPLTFGIGRAFLQAGAHRLEVEYFEAGGQQELRLEIEGPNLPRQPLDPFLSLTDQASRAEPGLAVDPDLARSGEQEFTRQGCKACHKPGPQSADKTPLARLRGERGCLAETPPGDVPEYRLGPGQRVAIKSALLYLRQPNLAPPGPVDAIRRTIVAFNCIGCHQRGELGGVDEAHSGLFTSNQPEMGDEGRIPPTLNGVGGKLKAEWLRQVLDQGATDRPYMHVRMPRFGANSVGHLADLFQQVDPVPSPLAEPSDISLGRMKAAGRFMAGSQGFSCIKCHTWGNVPSTGIQSISLTTMARRLRPEWAAQYLLEPQSYRQGTRMPASWPNGQVLLPKLLDGKSATQIEALWRYLEDGDKAAVPIGLGRDPIELTPTTEPIVYRNFIEGAGPRAIGVGYPEKVNLAFDANDLRLAMVWQGSFIDASRHWIDRGAGFQPPLGDNILKFPAGRCVAKLESAQAAWPTQTPRLDGYQFRGYRFDEKRRPTFLYEQDAIRFRESYIPEVEGEKFALRRSLHATGVDLSGWYFRAATGTAIVETSPGAYAIDGAWRTRIELPASAANQPLIRAGDKAQELLVPLQGTTAQIDQTIEW